MALRRLDVSQEVDTVGAKERFARLPYEYRTIAILTSTPVQFPVALFRHSATTAISLYVSHEVIHAITGHETLFLSRNKMGIESREAHGLNPKVTICYCVGVSEALATSPHRLSDIVDGRAICYAS